MSTQPINTTAWQDWRTTLTATGNYRAYHTKSLHRPAVDLYVAAIARYDENKKNPGNYLSVGQRVMEIYHSCLQFEDPESEWEFSRILGRGSLGVACLHQRRGERWELIDEVVSKSETPRDDLALDRNMLDVPREVFHIAQLNECRDEHANPRLGVVKLQGYKAIVGDTSTRGDDIVDPTPRLTNDGGKPAYREWRTFMENCSYGSLSRLILTYKAWGYHVPEAFVWWTFLWLMEACKAMDQDPNNEFSTLTDYANIRPIPQSFMLNNDVKDDNIFLGEPRRFHHHAPGVPFDTHPAARMGDFGLSRLTRIDINNRPMAFKPGTKPWMAPERREVKMGVDSNERMAYPFYKQPRVDEETWARSGGVPLTTRSHCIGPEANVWGAAMAIYVLMTFTIIWDVHNIIKYGLRNTNLTRDDDDVDKYVFDIETFPIFLDGDEDYSDELKNLVRECTRMEPTERPDIDTILQAIHEGIDREYNRLQEEFGGDDDVICEATRMAFMNTERHDVPQGPFNFIERSTPRVKAIGTTLTEWNDFYEVVERWADPTAPTLVVPGQWQIYDPEDGIFGRVEYTAQNPSRGRYIPPSIPFYGSDMKLYVTEDFIRGYHQGDLLPAGGRARWFQNMTMMRCRLSSEWCIDLY